jgi:hypothetical protein
MQADFVVWIEDAGSATVWAWDGAAWQHAGVLGDGSFRMQRTGGGVDTDLALPFAALGITDPAASGLRLLAVASEEDALALWSTLPTRNPVTSGRVTDSLPPSPNLSSPAGWRALLPYVAQSQSLGAGRPQATTVRPSQAAGPVRSVGLARALVWSRLGDDQCPNGRQGAAPGPTGGPFADSDLELRLTAEPVGTAYRFYGDGLFWWWAALFGADGAGGASLPAVGQLLGFLDNDHPPVGPDQTIRYALTWANHGTETARGVELELDAWLSLMLPEGTVAFDGQGQRQRLLLGDLPPGAGSRTDIVAQVDVAGVGQSRAAVCRSRRPAAPCAAERDWAALDVLVWDAQTPRQTATGGTVPPAEWLWADHAVDHDPPADVAIEAPAARSTIGRGMVLVQGRADDASALRELRLEARRSDGQVLPAACGELALSGGRWRCRWDPGSVADGAALALRAQAVDAFGQASEWSAWMELVVDQSAPTVTVEPGIDGRVLGAGGHTLRGTATDDHALGSVRVCPATGRCATVPVQAVGSSDGRISAVWSASLPAPDAANPDGEAQSVTVTALDGAGNASTPLRLRYRVDTVPPRLTVTSTAGKLTALEGATIATGTVTDGTAVEVYLDVTAPDGMTRRSEIGLHGLEWAATSVLTAAGRYELWVQAVDGAGNRTTRGPFAVDVTPAPGIFLPSISQGR